MNIFRWYNQNRGKFWATILVIVFLLLIIYTLNYLYKVQDQERNNRIAENSSNTTNSTQENVVQNPNRKQNQSMISGGTVPEGYEDIFSDLINNFFTYCKNHEPEKAYDLLSTDCKEILYPNVQIFIDQYYKNKFSNEKLYSFQSWTSKEMFIYQVRIYNNMLATGQGSDQQYIQDYVSIVNDNGEYKLNVDGFLRTFARGKEQTKNGITIKIDSSEIYMDYEILNVFVTNNTKDTVLLDSKTETDSVYAQDKNKVKFEAMLYENKDEELEIEPWSEKQIKIKFSNSYREGNNMKSITFSDVYANSENVEYGENNLEFTIEL